MMLYISLKFLYTIWNDFPGYGAGTKLPLSNFKGKSPKYLKKKKKKKTGFFPSARRLVMLYVAMKFHENILNGFRVIERT